MIIDIGKLHFKYRCCREVVEKAVEALLSKVRGGMQQPLVLSHHGEMNQVALLSPSCFYLSIMLFVKNKPFFKRNVACLQIYSCSIPNCRALMYLRKISLDPLDINLHV